jgi:nucleoside-diphosphate-sugar epimerase
MAVVVTGSAGFLGRSVVAELLRRGVQVVSVDRQETPSPAAHLVLTGDLLDRDELVDAAFETADAVLHLAGCPGVRDDTPDVGRRRARDNVAATARVLAAVPAHVPVVVASSSSVYGGSAGAPSEERHPVSPRGGYARSKVAVEQLCARRAAGGGQVTVVRPFTVVGEGQRPDMAVSRWIAAAEAGTPLQVYGSLGRTRDLTDVRDVARVLALLAEPGRAPSGVLNIGTGRPHSLGALVAAVAGATGTPVRTLVTRAAAVEPADTWACTNRLRTVVGFVPQTDLREVVARQVAAARDAMAGAA